MVALGFFILSAHTELFLSYGYGVAHRRIDTRYLVFLYGANESMHRRERSLLIWTVLYVLYTFVRLVRIFLVLLLSVGRTCRLISSRRLQVAHHQGHFAPPRCSFLTILISAAPNVGCILQKSGIFLHRGSLISRGSLLFDWIIADTCCFSKRQNWSCVAPSRTTAFGPSRGVISTQS